ncbi:hypothetical protein [Chitinivorax sp. B]|uniref:hypothetical protein n=1 Tax=Chitinivorax sp. B TaxID=2502235 RepID=UPI0010FA3F6E|nr:hypothetical protein [Chitinivorax sp. B]
MYLPDPRQFPRVDPKNPFIRQVMRVLTASDGAERGDANQVLQALLRDTLNSDDDSLLEAGLQNAPSQEAYKYLWGELREVLEQPPESGQRVVLFAIPLLLVAAASKGQAQVIPTLKDMAPLVGILQQHGVLAETGELSLSPKLVDLTTLQAWRANQQWRWIANLQDAARGLPVAWQETPFVAASEAVHLRFIVGAIMHQAGQPSPVRMSADATQWGMVLSQQISEQLKQDGLSLLAIPRGPQPLLQAAHSGRFARLEAGLQLFASGMIRKLRQAGETPVAVIASHERNEVRITVSAKENSERWEGYVWPLHPLDSVELIHDNAAALFRECRVDDIRVLPDVQADMRDALPLFLKAHDTLPNT